MGEGWCLPPSPPPADKDVAAGGTCDCRRCRPQVPVRPAPGRGPLDEREREGEREREKGIEKERVERESLINLSNEREREDLGE